MSMGVVPLMQVLAVEDVVLRSDVRIVEGVEGGLDRSGRRRAEFQVLITGKVAAVETVALIVKVLKLGVCGDARVPTPVAVVSIVASLKNIALVTSNTGGAVDREPPFLMHNHGEVVIPSLLSYCFGLVMF
jgi:hypothetical protein